ncbi:unnamed protein product, partial [Rotaria magnacalcarata]
MDRLSSPHLMSNYISPWENPPTLEYRPRDLRSEIIHSSFPAVETRPQMGTNQDLSLVPTTTNPIRQPSILETEYKCLIDNMRQEFETIKQTLAREQAEKEEIRSRLTCAEQELSAVSSDTSRKSRNTDRVKNRDSYTREVTQSPNGMKLVLKKIPKKVCEAQGVRITEESQSPANRNLPDPPSYRQESHLSVPPK